jgi:hypothetical protein
MYCSSCNFDLRGLSASVCPECGHTFNALDSTTYLDRPRSKFSRLLPRVVLGVGLAIVVGIVAGGYLVYRGVKSTMRAKERLQVTRVVGELIAEYVERSPTHSWPTSWDDLEKVPHTGCMFSWPQQAAEYKAVVNIDFTVTTAQVLQQTPRSCTAVTVSPGPSFVGSPAMELSPMFDRIRDAVANPPASDTRPSSP